MNPTNSIKLINQRFSQAKETGPNVIRAEERYNERPVGIYYFDFSEVIAEPQFDLKSYLQKTIATDYYQNEGSLQWNYYLYFVLDKSEFQSLQESGRVSEIELDRTFARKFVRDEKWFAEDLRANLSASLYSAGQPKDIASHWLQELTKAGLGRIADTKAAYTTTVDEFVKGTERAAPVSKNADPAKQTVPDGKHLEYLEIKTFRTFPSVRQFNFGKVNLIRGVNGSGKTSLLEAIELGICGGIRRQDGQNPANSSLVLGYVGEAKRIEAPVSDAGYYRNKDAQWYGGYYRRVNKLCENFGRFNFFDTDAGFRLSHGKTGTEIQEAIEALFLGEYASSLEAIMQSCLERFKTKAREFSDRILRASSEQSKIEADLATVRKIKNTTETLSKELTAKCASGGWLKAPNKMRQSELVTLEGNIGDACAQLKTAVSSIRWRSGISLKSLSEELTKLKNTDKEFTTNETNKERNAKSLNKMRESSEFLVAKLTLLQRLAAYHAAEDGFKLRGFGEAMESKRVRHDELKEAAAQTKNIELSAFEQNTAMFADVFKEFDANITSKKKQVNQKKRRIDELRKQFGEIKSLVEQIRGLGRHLCEYDPGVKECPVCGRAPSKSFK